MRPLVGHAGLAIASEARDASADPREQGLMRSSPLPSGDNRLPAPVDGKVHQLKHLTKMNIVAETIRSEILNGELPAGSQLLQLEIAARLGVSTTPVREAFSILETEGFLVRRPHRGVVVADRDFTSVSESYEVRVALEELAVKRLADDGESAAVELLRDSTQRSRHALKEADLRRFREESLRFHELIATGPGSVVLEDFLRVLRGRTVFHPPLGRDGMQDVQHDHESIVAAIERSDAWAAVESLNSHLMRSLEVARTVADRPTSASEAPIRTTSG